MNKFIFNDEHKCKHERRRHLIQIMEANALNVAVGDLFPSATTQIDKIYLEDETENTVSSSSFSEEKDDEIIVVKLLEAGKNNLEKCNDNQNNDDDNNDQYDLRCLEEIFRSLQEEQKHNDNDRFNGLQSLEEIFRSLDDEKDKGGLPSLEEDKNFLSSIPNVFGRNSWTSKS